MFVRFMLVRASIAARALHAAGHDDGDGWLRRYKEVCSSSWPALHAVSGGAIEARPWLTTEHLY